MIEATYMLGYAYHALRDLLLDQCYYTSLLCNSHHVCNFVHFGNKCPSIRGHGNLIWFWFYVIHVNAVHVCSVESRFEFLQNEPFVVNFVFADPFTLTLRNWVLLVLYCSAGIHQLNRDQLRNWCRYFTINLLIYHTGAVHQNDCLVCKATELIPLLLT